MSYYILKTNINRELFLRFWDDKTAFIYCIRFAYSTKKGASAMQAPLRFLNNNRYGYAFTATTSISTNPFLGSVFTATAERAGNVCPNWAAYTSFISPK